MNARSFRRFLIKLSSWEYWPLQIVYFPVLLYWLWCSLKARTFFYFTASNPGIKNGGLGGYSKFQVLEKVRKKPITLFFQEDTDWEKALTTIHENEIYFPFIAKPDEGERGRGVAIINTEKDLIDYLQKTEEPFIVQEYVDLEVEAGVFYIRYPDKEKGFISSVVIKDMLSVKGDGKSSLRELIKKNDRAFLQLETLEHRIDVDLNKIPVKGKKVTLNAIGNHCLGTTFLNGEHLITEKMIDSFDQMAKEIEGFYYGRFDVRAATLQDLENGNVMVIELNGANSEPAHIYQPGYSLIKGYKSIFFHWRILYKIGRQNIKKGYQLPGFWEGWKEVGRFLRR